MSKLPFSLFFFFFFYFSFSFFSFSSHFFFNPFFSHLSSNPFAPLLRPQSPSSHPPAPPPPSVHPQRRPPSRSPPGSTPAPPRSESKAGTPAHLHPTRLSLPLGLAGLSCRRSLGLPRSRPLGLRSSSRRSPPVQPLLVSLRRASGCPHGELPSAVLLPYGLADSPRRASGCRRRTTSLRRGELTPV